MDKETASSIKSDVLDCTRRLDESIKEVQGVQPGPSADAYRRLAGRIMGLLYTNLLMPIYSDFPDLEPSELKSPHSNALNSVLPPELTAQLSSLIEDIRRELLSLREKEDIAKRFDLEEVLETMDATLGFLRRMASTP